MLRTIELPDPCNWPPPSAEAQMLIAEAEHRIEQFSERRDAPLIHGFVASDFRAADGHLGWIVEQHLATGGAFCEWGSGFGVVAMLASLRQFDACGIEVEADLVEQARHWPRTSRSACSSRMGA